MKIKTLVPILLGFVLAAGIGVYAYQKNAPGKEEYMAAAIAYLEEQKTALDGAETIPMDIDWATGRVIRIHADSPYTIDRIISYLTNVTEVCRVEDIPELAYPLVYVGDKISGNNEKLYYSADKKILEFTLSETDSLAFLLYLTGSGSLYPEIKEFFIEGVIRQLQNEINFGGSDILKFSNGHLESIDIKTQETAEVLFECIRNCVQINDLTDVSLEPMALPILVNGRGAGTFEMFFATYQETGQFICISFAPEDSARFQDYVMELQKRYGVSIGAWLAMQALQADTPEQALLVSPVVDMEALITNMMQYAHVTEEQLHRAGEIPTDLGETLSWPYLCWVREHPLHWHGRTQVLYGDRDALTSRTMIERFRQESGAHLTILEEGEHWLHTPTQLAALQGWEQANL